MLFLILVREFWPRKLWEEAFDRLDRYLAELKEAGHG